MSEVRQRQEPRTTDAGSLGIQACYQCGRCTGLCPLARVDSGYSPRRVLSRACQGDSPDGIQSDSLWSCLTCGLCQQHCPMSVAYPEFVKQARASAAGHDLEPPCSHGGALQNLMKLMTRPELRQKRLDWVTDDLQTSRQGSHLYFVGCLPYFDVFFAKLGLGQLGIASSTVRLLNAAGIAPVLLERERCCGHDLLWEGQVEDFRKLAAINLQQIQEAGARTVVTSCAECARTLKRDYADLLGKPLPFEVKHLAELLDEKVAAGQLSFGALEEKVTYQDPCRLGRHLGIYDAPRRLLGSVEGLQLREMPHSRSNAICCGTSCWTGCDRRSRAIQRDRLSSAAATGAEVLVTACPKCAVHFRCSMYQEGYIEEGAVQLQDLAVLLSRAIADEGPAPRDSSPRQPSKTSSKTAPSEGQPSGGAEASPKKSGEEPCRRKKKTGISELACSSVTAD